MKRFFYYPHLTWGQNWEAWIQFVQHEHQSNDNILFVRKEEGKVIETEMHPNEVYNWLICQKYTVQDDQWPSRRWLPDGSEYVDLSGIPEKSIDDMTPLEKLTAGHTVSVQHKGQWFYVSILEDGSIFLSS